MFSSGSNLRKGMQNSNIPVKWDDRKLSGIAELIKANAGSIVRTSDAAYSIPENSETVILLCCVKSGIAPSACLMRDQN
jgi:hypothetical protein